MLLSGIVPAEKLTKPMFDDESFQKHHKLMKAMDEINQRFGKDTVRFASVKSRRGKAKATQLIGMNY